MLVVGALSIGQALHLSVVTGEVAPTSTPVVVYGVAGVVALAIGYRARRPIAEEYGLTSDARERGEHERSGRDRDSSPLSANRQETDAGGEGSTGDGAEFDPAMSPLGDAEPGETEASRDDDEESRH